MFFWSDFQTFLRFSFFSEHLVCNLLWLLVCKSSYKIKKGFFLVSLINLFLILKNTLSFCTYSHPRFLSFATYGCCHPCLNYHWKCIPYVNLWSISYPLRFINIRHIKKPYCFKAKPSIKKIKVEKYVCM